MVSSSLASAANAVLAATLAVALAACRSGNEPLRTIVDDAALADTVQGDNWLAFGRTSNEQRFSPLTQITDANVDGLAVDWYVDLPGDKGLGSTPLAVDGVLYFIGSMNIVRAVDATSGAMLWTYDPRTREYADRLRAGWDLSRGIAYWNGKVYVATWDGRLNAVDAATGTELWSVQTIDPSLAMYITGAPKVFKGKVLVGNGGTENGPSRGYVSAYDAETGEMAWRFWIVPGNPADGFENDAMRMAVETWTGEWWKHGGGGNAWHGFTYDAELDQLYIGTGNGSPWNRKVRSPDGGDNLFLCSIVALDPDTGEYLWHYQTVPGETWDYNSNMDIVLADLEIEGVERKVMLHAPKNGFFYVLDRTNGQLISAENFVETTWATGIDLSTGRPIENPDARYPDGLANVAPNEMGGHNWHAMSFNPRTGLAYYPAMHQARSYTDVGVNPATYRVTNWLVGVGVGGGNTGSTHPSGTLATLQAWDPVRQELAWEVPLPGVYNPGTMTTAGNLVFQGREDGVFVAYRADTGEELWRHDLGLGITAPPITYAVNGRQYVALLVGYGSLMARGREAASLGWAYGAQTRRLVAFSLEGTAELPPQAPPYVPAPIDVPFFEVDRAQVGRGAVVFGQKCSLCHGGGAVAGGLTPDLRASLIVTSIEDFASVVRDGTRAVNGMPQYADITLDELVALQHYIRGRAETDLAAGAR